MVDFGANGQIQTLDLPEDISMIVGVAVGLEISPE